MQRHVRATTDASIYVSAEVNLDMQDLPQARVLLFAGLPALANGNEGTDMLEILS